MEQKFIIALTEHRVLGYVFVPFWVQKQKEKEFYSATERITLANLQKYANQLSDDQVYIINKIEEYNDTQLLKLFTKKKISIQDFLGSVDKNLYENHLRPYIERRLITCIDVLSKDKTPMYFKDSQYNIYESDRIFLDDEPAETVFNFIRQEDSFRYFLTIRHHQQEMQLNERGIILVDNPCRLLLNNKLFIFDDINGKKLLPFFDKPHISIPKSAEKKYLETFVLNSIKNYRVNATGFEIDEMESHPQAVLSLERNLHDNPVLVLKFMYNKKHLFLVNQSPDVMVKLTTEEGRYVFKKLKRDKVFETVKISEIISMGLKNTDVTNFELPGIKKIEDKAEKINEFVEWINEHEKEFNKKGIELNQDFLEQTYNMQSISLKISVDDSKDWFDIKAIVQIGRFNIPFIKFRNHIMQQQREYELPSGEIVILPKEWFEKYKDLFAFGALENDGMKLKKHHFSILEKSLEKVNKKYIKELTGVFEGQNGDTKLPDGINAQLRPYQSDGYHWMYSFYKSGMGVCLSDDMGLGKTLQTITLLKKVIQDKTGANGLVKNAAAGTQLSIFDQVTTQGNEVSITNYVPASLIVMPSSLVHNWHNEIKKFAPGLKVLNYIGSNRLDDISRFDDYNIVLTTYGLVRNEIDKLIKYNFFYVVLDESQYIKNPGAKAYQAVIKLCCEHRLVLTGTPIENSLVDLWSQMNFLNHGLLGNLNFFKKEFVHPIEKYQDEDKEAKLKAIITPFILRRTKKEVARDLPDISENIIYCDMAEDQKRIYEEEKSRVRNIILENIERKGKEQSTFLILQALTKLRQLANHPKLVDNELDNKSGKFDEIIRNVKELVQEKHKVLIYSSFVKNLQLFADYFKRNNYEFAWLTGGTRDREKVINEFQQSDDVRIFLISLKAGGVGLNLTAADYVFILDPWWNPAVENQAINRAHRIGQDKNVFVYRFISNETIEEKIVCLQQKKAQLADSFINDQNVLKAISVDELMELVG